MLVCGTTAPAQGASVQPWLPCAACGGLVLPQLLRAPQRCHAASQMPASVVLSEEPKKKKRVMVDGGDLAADSYSSEDADEIRPIPKTELRVV